ncbi:MAG: peptidyl-prolyl cis-trans isomerase [Polyangiaceae bacterium]|nr:peptidyl-prolyl cis-trans isomerase [Polyangiaceae bacterium]
MTKAASSRPRRARVFARLVVLGALLFGARRWLVPADAERRSVVVRVEEGASPAQIDAAIETAILLDVAKRERWARSDAVVRERMLRGVGVIEDVSTGVNAAVDRGIALGLHESDNIARERLLSNARRELAREPGGSSPSDDETASYVRANEARYRAPSRTRFQQIFLSAQKRGASLEGDAAKLEAALGRDPQSAISMSDPWPWTDSKIPYTRARLDAVAGEGFGAAVEAAPVGAWTGPIRSSFGIHFVRVDDRVEAQSPPLAAVIERARAELESESRKRRFEVEMRRLRARYDVTLETRR